MLGPRREVEMRIPLEPEPTIAGTLKALRLHVSPCAEALMETSPVIKTVAGRRPDFGGETPFRSMVDHSMESLGVRKHNVDRQVNGGSSGSTYDGGILSERS
jgi:hypothetical protein